MTAGPLLDLKVRWKAGHAVLGAALLLAAVALVRPLAPGSAPRLRLAVTLALGLGVAASAFLASLKRRGTSEQLAFYAFLALSLDGLGQILSALGWPIWPLMALLVTAVAVAEAPAIAYGVAALASLLAVADEARGSFGGWKAAVASTLGYAALVAAVHVALRIEKRRLIDVQAELARLRHGIDALEESEPAASPSRPSAASLSLRQVSEEGRRARQLEHAADLDQALAKVVRTARAAVEAHAIVYFDLDRESEKAHPRAGDGPPALVMDTAVSLRRDPFAFVLDRNQSFYATDFKKLLWDLPYYRGEVKVGTLLALPVRTAGGVRGVLVADRLEIQSFTGGEPELLASFADLIADTITRVRVVSDREARSTEYKAIYEVSGRMAATVKPTDLRRLLLQAARNLVPAEGAAVVSTDGARYAIENAHGWVTEFEGREVGLLEKTWTGWLLKSGEPSLLLDDLLAGSERMPILVLDEGSSRAESLLGVALRVQNEFLGALVLTGKRGAFDSTAQRVLTVLANQAAGSLYASHLVEQKERTSLQDALTGLANRRAFDQTLETTIAREERQAGRFALLLLDIDHFKKLNDTYGHPAGDAALKNTAALMVRHLRKGDVAARHGGEEFAAILPATDEAGAVLLAERLRQEIEKSRLVFEGARLGVTVSLGVAVWPQAGKDAAALVSAADRALYAAKQGGRNRVFAASQPQGADAT